MTRAALVWGGAAALLLGLGALALGIVVATTATPANHVQRYLDALARDDLAAAARWAALPPPTAMPLGDEGAPEIVRIISSSPETDGVVAVVAEYGGSDDAVRVTFRLEPAPAILGFLPAWAFTTPPVASLSVAADQHDRVVVNDRVVTTAGPGEAASVAVFVPARVTGRLDEPLLRAEPLTVRVGAGGEADTSPLVLTVQPSARLDRAVAQQVDSVLIGCATQRVLQPAGCPFGIEIDDRVVSPPVWVYDVAPELIIEPGDQAGVWRVRGEGAVQLTVTVQQLFDGVVIDRDEPVGFVVRGQVVLEPAGPVLTLYPPGG